MGLWLCLYNLPLNGAMAGVPEHGSLQYCPDGVPPGLSRLPHLPSISSFVSHVARSLARSLSELACQHRRLVIKTVSIFCLWDHVLTGLTGSIAPHNCLSPIPAGFTNQYLALLLSVFPFPSYTSAQGKDHL